MLEVEIAVTQGGGQRVVPFEIAFGVVDAVVEGAQPVQGVLTACRPVGIGRLREVQPDVARTGPVAGFFFLSHGSHSHQECQCQ